MKEKTLVTSAVTLLAAVVIFNWLYLIDEETLIGEFPDAFKSCCPDPVVISPVMRFTMPFPLVTIPSAPARTGMSFEKTSVVPDVTDKNGTAVTGSKVPISNRAAVPPMTL